MSGDLNFVVVDIDADVPLAERQAYAAAQQDQLRTDFAPLWDGMGEDDTVRAATPDKPVAKGDIEVQLLQDPPPDQQGAYAYHARKPDGTPICYVFVGLCKRDGESWTKAASHEVLETRGDPRLNDCVQGPDGTIWAREVCDACESIGYEKNGVTLSDFTTPAYWSPNAGDTRFNFLSTITAAFALLSGGYMQKYDPRVGWRQITMGELSPYRAALKPLNLGRTAQRLPRAAESWWKRLCATLASLFSRHVA